MDLHRPEHLSGFDLLRCFAALCVIFMHTVSERLRGALDLTWQLANLLTSLAFTAVPLFLLMSGSLLLSAEHTRSVSVLLKKRLPRLVVPLAAWTAVYLLWKLLTGAISTPTGLLQAILSAFHTPVAMPLWYMYTILALYLLSPLLYSALHGLDRSGHIYVLALIGLISLKRMLQTLLPDRLDPLLEFGVLNQLCLFGGNLCTFVLGYYLGNLKRRLPLWLLIGGAVSLWAFISLGTGIRSLRSGCYVDSFQYQSVGYEVLLAGCLFLLVRQHLEPLCRRLQRWLTPLGALSLPVYLMHGLVLLELGRRGLSAGRLLTAAALTGFNAVLCYLTAKTAASLRPLCYLFTGQTYAAARRSSSWQYTLAQLRRKR